MQKYLVFDFETFSEADIEEVGSYEYARHPSTEILCVAWTFGTKEELATSPIGNWSPALSPTPPRQLVDMLCDPKIIIKAHNAFFEQNITRFVLTKYEPLAARKKELRNIPTSRWRCTAAQAAALALPRKLEHVCLALKLKEKKDLEGHKLMMKMSNPKRPSKKDPSTRHLKLSDLKRLMQYCDQDVRAETELFLKIPELTASEQKLWELDQAINARGFYCDLELVKTVLAMIAIEIPKLTEELYQITNGVVSSPNQRAVLLNWIHEQGVMISDLQAKTIAETLANDSGLAPEVVRALNIRQATSKSSTAKYGAFIKRANTDGRLRDILMYHGASTGRWTGLGVQPHNFIKSVLPYPQVLHVIEILKTNVPNKTTLELLRLIYGDPMTVFASCLRSVIQAPPGSEIFCADFNAIETRVLFWLADHQKGLSAYRDNKDLYREMASVIFNKQVADVTSDDREVGKRVILGCGYQMGAPTFVKTCKQQYGLDIPLELAKRAVKAYRTIHHPVQSMWDNIQKAAVSAIRDPNRRFIINNTVWWTEDNFLYCKLPSGRKLAYYGARIKMEPVPWNDEELRPTIWHWGVHPKTKQWVFDNTYGGKLTENVVQAVARDFMAAAMLRLEAKGYQNILTVHDEILCERKIGTGNLNEFEETMSAIEKWGDGCPIKVKGFVGARYRK